MKSKRILALGIAAAMGASMLAGCGSTTPAASSAAPSSAAAESTAASTAAASTAATTAETEGDASTGTTPRNETLYYSGLQWSKVNDWNPMSSNSNNMVMQQNDTARELVWETLYMYNMLDGKLYPLIADGDYTWNDTQTELTVKIKSDAKFNDGSQLKASDVKATYDANVKYKTSLGSDYSTYIDSIEAPDDTTVIIKAKMDGDKAVNPLKVLDLIPKMYIMSEAYIKTVDERNGGDADKIKADTMEDAVSSGPYKMFYSSDQKVVLQRDDNYWGQAASMWGKLPAPKYIAHNIYKDNERRQGGRKFYIPSVDEILDYSENGYPTKSASYQRLGRFLLDEMKVSDAVKDQVLFFIYKECSMDGRMSAIMENLNQKGIQFNDEQLEKFTKLIMEANNNTRMLEFRGYTPNEISGAVWPFATGKPHTAMPNSFVPTAMPMQPASARKIYPNDPCPCGSGKKYKKCCGRR